MAGNGLLSGWPRTPCPVLGTPPRAAVPGRGCSRGGSADPLGGGRGRSTTPAIRHRGQRAPGTARAEGRERALGPRGSQAGRSVLSGSGRGLSPLQTSRKLTAPGSDGRAGACAGLPAARLTPDPTSEGVHHTRRRPEPGWNAIHDALGKEWVQGLISKSRALSELEQGGVQWPGGCRQRDGGLGSSLRAVGESLKSATKSNAHLAPNGL